MSWHFDTWVWANTVGLNQNDVVYPVSHPFSYDNHPHCTPRRGPAEKGCTHLNLVSVETSGHPPGMGIESKEREL